MGIAGGMGDNAAQSSAYAGAHLFLRGTRAQKYGARLTGAAVLRDPRALAWPADRLMWRADLPVSMSQCCRAEGAVGAAATQIAMSRVMPICRRSASRWRHDVVGQSIGAAANGRTASETCVIRLCAGLMDVRRVLLLVSVPGVRDVVNPATRTRRRWSRSAPAARPAAAYQHFRRPVLGASF